MAEDSAEIYRQRAAEMKTQAQRAETVTLQAIYSSIADNWDRLAAQMQAAERAGQKDRATGNWEKIAQEEDAEENPAPPPGLIPNNLVPNNLAPNNLAQDKGKPAPGRL